MSSNVPDIQPGTVFLSSLLDKERLPFQDPELVLGQAHYSWKLIHKLYEDGLSRAGLLSRNIVRPEIYQAPVAQNILNVTPRDLHIAIKPVEHLRPFYGMPNLFVCGWEFPEFFPGLEESSPFDNQLAVLKRADRILCWSDFTRDNLQAAGLSHAITLPPPILPVDPGGDRAVMEMPATFLANQKASGAPVVTTFGAAVENLSKPILLAVLNPYDKRKRIEDLLKGALQAEAEGHDFLLVIKLIIDGQATQIKNIGAILKKHYAFRAESNAVLFCAGQLENRAMAALRARSDFHIGASSAEGLNLPLVEAALQDIPIISTRNTAMERYLGADDAIWIECSPKAASQAINAFAEHASFTHYPASPTAICAAICHALSLDDGARKDLAQRGRQAVEARFGQPRFEADFHALANEVLA